MSNPLVKYAVYNLIAAVLGAIADAVFVTVVLYIQGWVYPGSVFMAMTVYALGWGIAWVFILKTLYVIEAYVEYSKMSPMSPMSPRRVRRPVGDVDADGELM